MWRQLTSTATRWNVARNLVFSLVDLFTAGSSGFRMVYIQTLKVFALVLMEKVIV
jgi:hypothetical protein